MHRQPAKPAKPAKLTQPATVRARACLWGQDPDAAHLIPLVLARADIAVSVVDSADALLAADRQGDVAFLIIDCSVGSDALDRCLLVVTHIARPIHICHPRQEFVADLVPLARGPLLWLPLAWTGLFLLDKARILLAQAAVEAETPPNRAVTDRRVPIAVTPPSPLTPRERQVQRLVYLHHSNAQIAAQLGIAPHTVKNHIAEGMARLDLHSRRAFGAAYDPSQTVHDPQDRQGN